MFFHPPHLYYYLAKQTLLLLSALCLHFSRNVMVSLGVSCMGKTRVVFIDPGAKVNSSHYCNILLDKGLLPDVRAICRRSLQVDTAAGWSASAHRPEPRATMDYLNKEHTNLRYLGTLSATSLYHQRQFKTVEELEWAIVTEWQKL